MHLRAQVVAALPLLLAEALLGGCGNPCAEEQAVVYQTWDISSWQPLDDLPAEPAPPTPVVEGVIDTQAFEDLAEGFPRETTWIRTGVLSEDACGPSHSPCYSYELIIPLTHEVEPGEHAVDPERGVPIGLYLTLFTRDRDITEPDPGRDGGRYFENTPGSGTVWVDEFGPDVKLRYDVTFDNGEGRVRHVVGSLETERSVQCVAD